MNNAQVSRRKMLLVNLCLISATLVVYGQVINFDFVGFDDQIYVTENQWVQTGLTLEGVKRALTTFYAGNWHPITWLSHMLDCEIYGLNPAGHHLTGLLFHLANTLLLFFIFTQMTEALWKSAVVAALFALHPLHVESVAWVAGRKDVLSTFLGLLSLWAYYRYTEQPRFFNYLMTILFLSLGLMAKSMLVTLPFVFLLLDFWPLGRCDPFCWKKQIPGSKERVERQNTARQQREANKARWIRYNTTGLILEKIPLLIPVAAAGILTFWAEHNEGTIGHLTSFSIGTRIANAFCSYASYLAKTVWPLDLSVYYPHPADTLPLIKTLGSAALIGAVSFWAVRASKKHAYVFVGWFWFIGTLVPVIGLVQIGGQAMADRYTYIPLIGFFLVMVWGGTDLLKRRPFGRQILTAASIIILAVLTSLSFLQAGYWKNAVTLFQHAVEIDNDNGLAHNNLGAAYNQLGQLDQAVFHYKEALRINSNDLIATLNLAKALSNQGHRDRAIYYYRKALKIKPDSEDAHNALAVLLSAAGRLDEAAVHCSKALRINPNSWDAHDNFGNLLLKQGRLNAAGRHFAEAIRINPDDAKGYNNIGYILARQGKLKKAFAFFSKALQIDPDNMQARKNLAEVKRNLSSYEP